MYTVKNASKGSNSSSSTSGNAVSIGFLDSNGNKISPGRSASRSHSARSSIQRGRGSSLGGSSTVEFWITRDSALATNMPSFQYINASSFNMSSGNQLATFTVTLADLNQAVFVNIQPEDDTVSYLLATKFGQTPVISNSTLTYDTFKILCSNTNLIQGSDFNYYLYFSSSENNVNSVVSFSYGLRQLTTTEYHAFCVNQQTPSSPPVLPNTNSTFFTADFQVRTYSSGCFYLDSGTGKWASNNLVIQSDTTLDATHCKSSALTPYGSQVSGGVIPLPSAIDFNYVFSHMDFLSNLTIYLTVIIVASVYIILFVLLRIMDKRDEAKCAIHLCKDNDPENLYFYEIIVHTATRPNAQTDSRVFVNLVGHFDETVNRRLESRHKNMKVFQRGSVNTFVLSVKK
jgi:hypothetical protein